MKVIELEEKLEAMQRLQKESKAESSSEVNHAEQLKQMEALSHENAELYNRISKLEEKGTSDTGSTESFEAIQDLDKTDLLKKIEDLTQKNNELTHQLSILQGNENSHAGSIELIGETDKNELLKKIDQLTQENTDLTMKLNRMEEKGSSDTGSTESFERIPEHTESMTKIVLLAQEGSELMIKSTKLEEQLENIESKSDIDRKLKIDTLLQESENQSVELTKLRNQVADLLEQNNKLQEQIDILSVDNTDLADATITLENENVLDEKELSDDSKISKREVDLKQQIDMLMKEKVLLEKEITQLRNSLEQVHDSTQDQQINDLSETMGEILRENADIATKVSDLKTLNQKLNKDLTEIMQEKEELHVKLNQMLHDDPDNERLELVEKLEKLNREKQSAAEETKELQEQIETLLQKSNQKVSEVSQLDESLPTKIESIIVDSLEHEIEECKKLIAEQTGLIEEMKIKLASKEIELEEKGLLRTQIMEYEESGKKVQNLEFEMKEMFETIDEWKFKCNEMQEKLEKLEAAKASIEEGFRMLQNENEILLDEKKEKDAEATLLKQQLQDVTTTSESKLQEQLAAVSEKENEIGGLKEVIEEKSQELHAKYMDLQNEMIVIDSLQDELNNSKTLIKHKENLLTSLYDQVANLNSMVEDKEEEIYSLRKEIDKLNEKVEESKPLKDYNDLLEQLKNKDKIVDELHCGINATTKENSNLLEKVKNLSQQNSDAQNQLAEKQQELADLMTTKDHLETQVVEARNDKSDAESRIWGLQDTIDNTAKFAEDLGAELQNSYKQIEQLKVKHIEDTQLQNQRLENLIEELNSKMQECETLKGELEQKEKLIGQNMTGEVKIALDSKVAELEQKLKESDDKIQMQLEKMKKIAANLKKKTAICQELESRVTELEEKWTTEKDEKEAKNKQIQDVEIAIREKDNRIADLEEKLMQARNESVETSKNIDRLTNDLAVSKEKMSLLTKQVSTMTEEITKLRADLEWSTTELEFERESKQNIISEYDSYKQQINDENEEKQVELDEMKEKARELSVRMQVMESEYVEQLTLINNLKAENGLLLSKQAQINERLENVEKESEDRRLLIQQMEKAVVSTSTETTQTSEEETAEDDTKVTGVQHCNHCEQCQTVVQALEAKLQEREAEIENLDNELANSIGNFVQMRESLRFNDLMNQTSMRNRSLEDPYNGLLFQYNSLISNHEELKTRLEEALKENKELVEKIEELQSLNATLEEKINTTERTLDINKENAEKLQSMDLLNSDLIKKCEEREAELSNMQQEMQDIRERSNQGEQQLNSEIASLKSIEAQKVEEEILLRDAKNSLEREIQSLRVDKEASEREIKDLRMELEMYRNQSVESVEKGTIIKREAPAFDTVPQENAPQLFDASKIFGMPSVPDADSANQEVKRLQSLLDEKETQSLNLTQEINDLQQLMTEERAQISQNYSECVQELEMSRKQLQTVQINSERLEQVLAEKDIQINSLNAELGNLSIQIIEQRNDTDNNVKESLLQKDNQLEELKMRLDSIKEALGKLVLERDQQNALLDTYKLQINNFEAELNNSSVDSELIQDLESRLSVLTKERDLLQLQVNDLSSSMNELQDSANIGRHLQTEIEKTIRERDEAKEVIANLTRALADTSRQSDQTSAITDTSTKESTPMEETMVQSQETKNVVTEHILQDNSLDIGESWDTGSAEKLNVDEEAWEWNADDTLLAGEQQLAATVVPTVEMQLRAKVDDLLDQVENLEKEKETMLEDSKTVQLRNAKMIKKLKEYKVQLDSLQQQLKIQKSASEFDELDSAIEEELKSQISKLENSLSQAKEEQKNTVAEKEALLKRLDVIVSANERYMEMKERQDMDIEVLHIRNKELSDKLELLDKRLQGGAAGSEGNNVPQNESVYSEEAKPDTQDRLRKSSDEQEEFESLCKKYKDEIDDLKDEMEALATENEQLQHFLEEQKMKMSHLESKRISEDNESIQIIDDLNKKISELQGMLSKSREEYDLLRKQYEQSLMDANDQVTVMRENADFLKEESLEKVRKLEMEVTDLHQQVQTLESNAMDLQKNLQNALQERAGLEERLIALTASEKQVSSANASMSEVTDLLNIRIQEVADLKQELQRQYVHHEEAKVKLHDAMQALNQELNEKKQELESLKKSFNEKENELVQQQGVETVSVLVSQATQELVKKHDIEVEEKAKEIRLLNEKLSALEMAMNEYAKEKENNIVQFDSQWQELELLKQSLIEMESIVASVQANLSLTGERLAKKEFELSESEERLQKFSLENQRYMEAIEELHKRVNESDATSINTNEYVLRIQNLEQQIQSSMASLIEKDTALQQYAQESAQYRTILENNQIEISNLRTEIQKVEALKGELMEKTERINNLTLELERTCKVLEETRHSLNERQIEMDRSFTVQQDQRQQGSSNVIDGFPVFRMNDNQNLQHTIETMQAQLESKQEEIDHLKYILSENTYPSIIQEMQERINCLYNEKAELQASLDVVGVRAEEKDKQIVALKEQMETQNQDYVSKEEANLLNRDRRSMQDQEQIVRLQNELYAKEQEIGELKYIIAEKDSQLSLHASMEPQSDDFELREMVQRLTTELYSKEQETEYLKSVIAELQKEVSRLHDFERLSEETRDAVEKLNIEKEQVRLEAQEFLEQKLREKEMEIDEIKQKLHMENRSVLDELQLRDRDIENAKRQLQDSSVSGQKMKDELHQKEDELIRLSSDLAEKERRLAELSITKDTELYNLRVQIHEKDVRIEELLTLSDEEEKQLKELKTILEAREIEINSLKALLEDKMKEYELIQNVLKKDVPVIDASAAGSVDTSGEERQALSSQELDLALYMLHQRDVRCEELTQELMQLLEERDTLQLRLSNAIRVNEELRKVGGSVSTDLSPKKEVPTSGSVGPIVEPIVEHPSPSKSEGPVEIAKEAIDTSIGEDKETLALKYVLRARFFFNL